MRFLIFIFITANLFAQDTIRFKDGKTLAIKIDQIGSNGIKYHKFKSDNDKQYYAAKADLVWLKTRTGEVDSLKKIGKTVTNLETQKAAETLKEQKIASDVKQSSIESQNNQEINASAIDTIRFLDGEVKSVKITGFDISILKYRNLDYLDGPEYFVRKTEIRSIKYNAANESLKFTNVRAAKPDLQISSANLNNVKKNNVYYYGANFSHRSLEQIISSCQFPETKNELKLMYEQHEKYYHRQKISAYVGIGLGALGLGVPFISVLVLWENLPDAGFLAAGGSLVSGIASLLISNSYKNKKKGKIKEMAILYNEWR